LRGDGWSEVFTNKSLDPFAAHTSSNAHYKYFG
jgi:hypothetical protein